MTRERFGALKEAGLQGIEVDHVEHDEPARRELRQIAADLDLVATGSSDFHGERKPNRLGCCTTEPDQYERLRELFGAAQPLPERLTLSRRCRSPWCGYLSTDRRCTATGP